MPLKDLSRGHPSSISVQAVDEGRLPRRSGRKSTSAYPSPVLGAAARGDFPTLDDSLHVLAHISSPPPEQMLGLSDGSLAFRVFCFVRSAAHRKQHRAPVQATT